MALMGLASAININPIEMGMPCILRKKTDSFYLTLLLLHNNYRVVFFYLNFTLY